MSGREVHGRLPVIVYEPTGEQFWAAARTLARLASSAGTGAETLRAVLEAVGFDPAKPPEPSGNPGTRRNLSRSNAAASRTQRADHLSSSSLAGIPSNGQLSLLPPPRPVPRGATVRPHAHRCHCGATWTALGTAHCGACHETFSSVAGFDLHRIATGDHGGCLTPQDVRRSGQPILELRDGMWRFPEMSEEAKRARRGK